MGRFRHTLRQWHQTFLSELGVIEPQPTVDLASITAKVYGGCMGLPQEVVERIMDILQGNLRTLKACSLTCKSMFASTRHLIHRTLRFTKEANRRIFTPAEEKRYTQGDHHDLELRFLSFVAERDLLKYTRHLNIRMGSKFYPYILEPHLRHFQSLDWIDTLTIDSYDPLLWYDAYNTHFTQFYPTLTTLVLDFPIGHHRYVLQFALQFPNLQNLTLNRLQVEARGWQGIPVPPIVSQSPPLRGNFRCARLSPVHCVWPKEFAFSLPNGINFRSIEFLGVYCERGQEILNGCANSLQEFSVYIISCLEPVRFQFLEHRSLRSIVIRIPSTNLSALTIASLWTSLSTITSLSFSEFVLELGIPPSEFTQQSPNPWAAWEKIDKLLGGLLYWCPDFKLVIRTDMLHNSDEFRAKAKEGFPFMAKRDRIQFEYSILTVEEDRS